MTAQINDRFIYEEKVYDCYAAIFDIYELGLYPVWENTGCWRGYVATFALDGDKLVLKALDTNNGNKRSKIPAINGVQPEVIKKEGLVDGYENFRKLRYKGINLQLDYTGSVIIKGEFIFDRYVHMGFQSPTSYETVIELVFEKGILKSKNDLSGEMAKRTNETI